MKMTLKKSSIKLEHSFKKIGFGWLEWLFLRLIPDAHSEYIYSMMDGSLIQFHLCSFRKFKILHSSFFTNYIFKKI